MKAVAYSLQLFARYQHSSVSTFRDDLDFNIVQRFNIRIDVVILANVYARGLFATSSSHCGLMIDVAEETVRTWPAYCHWRK